MRNNGGQVEDETDEERAAPMMFVEQPPRLDGRSASDVLQLLQALIDTIEDDYAEVLEQYWAAEANALHERTTMIDRDIDGDDSQLELGLSGSDDFRA